MGRQLLLARETRPIADTIENLVGMQAQNPLDPYFGLWARLDNFDPAALAGMVQRREVVRMQTLRSTIHLVTAEDAQAIVPLIRSVLVRTHRSTQFAKDTAGVDQAALLELARSLLEERPRTRAELAPLLEKEFPHRLGASLAQTATYLLSLVQVPPRGVWGATGPAAWTTVERWLGRPLGPGTTRQHLALRYLASFGPAAPKDMRTWSGLTQLREAFEELRPQLLTFRDENGTELFDLPDAPRPPPDTEAPPRLLPEYDNLLLSHADRSRFFQPRGPQPAGWVGGALIDGFFAGTWKLHRRRQRRPAMIEVTVGELSRSARAGLEGEVARLAGLVGPDGSVSYRIG